MIENTGCATWMAVVVGASIDRFLSVSTPPIGDATNEIFAPVIPFPAPETSITFGPVTIAAGAVDGSGTALIASASSVSHASTCWPSATLGPAKSGPSCGPLMMSFEEYGSEVMMPG